MTPISNLQILTSRRTRVLLVEDNPGDVRLTREAILSEEGASLFELVAVSRLDAALARLGGERFDVVLLDLGLPDARGLSAVGILTEAVPSVPIVVLSGQQDQELAVQAVQRGAQDYLVKGRSEGNLVRRAILYAIERKRAEQRISHLAYYDGLTEIPNRRLLYDRLEHALAVARRGSEMVALLFLDLDHFKNINDSLGHSVGDRLLKGVADRLDACTRDSDTVARLGGDEFALVMCGVMRIDQVAALADKMLEALRPPFVLEGHELYASASIGISVYPADGGDAETLLKNADIAMYGAKQRGRNNRQFYAPPMNARAMERLSLAGALRHALEREELLLHYQPQVRLDSGRVIGVEALLRWRCPSRGLVEPATFIPLAEETGLIGPIGEWVFRNACERSRDWRGADRGALRVAVNVSGRQLNGGLPEALDAILEAGGMDPGLLELELTENGLMQNVETATKTLKELKAMGVRIAIDDFGTGRSSLSYLKQFAIDTLKIDRSFVSEVTTDRNDAAIGTAIIAMAHGLGLEVIAEGVETPEQLAFLREHGCDGAQGYYFSEALSPEALADGLRAGCVWNGAQAGEGTV